MLALIDASVHVGLDNLQAFLDVAQVGVLGVLLAHDGVLWGSHSPPVPIDVLKQWPQGFSVSGHSLKFVFRLWLYDVALGVEEEFTPRVFVFCLLPEQIFVHLKSCDVPFIRFEVKGVNLLAQLYFILFTDCGQLDDERDQHLDGLGPEGYLVLKGLLCEMQDFS